MREFPGYTEIIEPKLTFDALTNAASHFHPLKGLCDFGPYSSRLVPMPVIRIACIYPEGTYHIIESIIRELSMTHKPQERRDYLVDFPGFESAFKSKIELVDKLISIPLDGTQILSTQKPPYIWLSESLGNAIRSMSQRKQDFDVLCIYLPESWNSAFEDKDSGFDLHDFIKATTAMQNIPTQIIREGRAIMYKCRCSVMWRLSIALYVKAGGIPWKLASIDTETAFIGLSYAMRLNKHTNQYDFTTCCSQVFDSDGTGLEFLAYDVGEIESRVGDNPFLTRSEMRKVISKSLNLYQRRHAGRLPKRIIIHKTTYFTKSEIDGAFDSVPSNVNIELLQIIQDTPWRGIKYINNNDQIKADNYPIQRGSYFQIDQHEILLWTQGVVKINGNNYFKEGKNIPQPLSIRRFAGVGGWDQNCQAILGLTKMNWNHDGLYDRLPVTLGYASVLATTIKRMGELSNKPFEFRFFM